MRLYEHNNFISSELVSKQEAFRLFINMRKRLYVPDISQTNNMSNGQTNGETNRQTNGQNNSQTNSQTNGQINGQINGETNSQTNGQIKGETNGETGLGCTRGKRCTVLGGV